MEPRIFCHCRHDLDDLFAKSGILESERLDHTPFLVVVPFPISEEEAVPGVVAEGWNVSIIIVKNAVEMVHRFSDDIFCMVQWPGKWRSDWFKMTVGEVRAALVARGLVEADAPH
jgi:hypothetical protein